MAKSNKIEISLEKDALDHITKKSFNPNEGARIVRRNLQEMVEDLISEGIIDGSVKEGDSIKLCTEKDRIVLRKNKKQKQKIR